MNGGGWDMRSNHISLWNLDPTFKYWKKNKKEIVEEEEKVGRIQIPAHREGERREQKDSQPCLSSCAFYLMPKTSVSSESWVSWPVQPGRVHGQSQTITRAWSIGIFASVACRGSNGPTADFVIWNNRKKCQYDREMSVESVSPAIDASKSRKFRLPTNDQSNTPHAEAPFPATLACNHSGGPHRRLKQYKVLSFSKEKIDNFSNHIQMLERRSCSAERSIFIN